MDTIRSYLLESAMVGMSLAGWALFKMSSRALMMVVFRVC